MLPKNILQLFDQAKLFNITYMQYVVHKDTSYPSRCTCPCQCDSFRTVTLGIETHREAYQKQLGVQQ